MSSLFSLSSGLSGLSGSSEASSFFESCSNSKPPINLLVLEGVSILEQLKIEEALLKADSNNWCLLNTGSIKSIILGISGKLEQLIDFSYWEKSPIPIIRRFTGGGTVVVDQDTVFATMLFNKKSLPVESYPQSILKWSEQFYRPIFDQFSFSLRENDYTCKDKKFGGNALYIRKDRWLHHCSLLWNFQEENMQYLLYPPKTPDYRKNRSHSDFLCSLKPYFFEKSQVVKKIIEEVEKSFVVTTIKLENVIKEVNSRSYRKTTVLYEEPELFNLDLISSSSSSSYSYSS